MDSSVSPKDEIWFLHITFQMQFKKVDVMAGYMVCITFTFMKIAVFRNVTPYSFVSICIITVETS
jgi:hypothetical protein